MQTYPNSTVKYSAGKSWPSKHNPNVQRQNVVITDATGVEHTIWFDQGTQPWAGLQKGQTLTLAKSPSGDYLQLPEQPAQPAQPVEGTVATAPDWTDRPASTRTPMQLPRDGKQPIDDKQAIDKLAETYVDCLAAVMLHMSRNEGVRGIDYEFCDVSKMATSIFIQFQRNK